MAVQTTRRRLVSIQTAAEYVDLDARTIRRRISDGTLPAYRLGGTIRIDLDDLDRALKAIPTVRGE